MCGGNGSMGESGLSVSLSVCACPCHVSRMQESRTPPCPPRTSPTEAMENNADNGHNDAACGYSTWGSPCCGTAVVWSCVRCGSGTACYSDCMVVLWTEHA